MSHLHPITKNSTVFLGDSLTEAFDLEGYFGKQEYVNRGISGDTTTHVVYRLREIINAKPARVFLMIGINDLFGGSKPEQVYLDIVDVIERLEDDNTGTELIVQSILPVRENNLIIDEDMNTKIYKVNDLLRTYCKHNEIRYIDLHTHFLDRHGQMGMAYTYDGAHLTEKGYDLWAKVLRSVIG